MFCKITLKIIEAQGKNNVGTNHFKTMQVCPELTEGRLYYKAPHPFGKVFGRQNFKPWEIKRITQKTETDVSTSE